MDSPETSPWVEAVQLGAMSTVLGILGLSVLYESSQVVGYKASYKKNKRDANTSFWLRYYTGLFLFLSFLFFLV